MPVQECNVNLLRVGTEPARRTITTRIYAEVYRTLVSCQVSISMTLVSC